MTSVQISLTPSRRAAGRFVAHVRRTILQALAEEKRKRGLNQADIARCIGVNRSVINRELRGQKDLSIGRVAEFAWVLGREALFDLPEPTIASGTNVAPSSAPAPVPTRKAPLAQSEARPDIIESILKQPTIQMAA